METRTCFVTARLAEDDAIGSPPQRTLEQVVETDFAAMRFRLALCREQVGFTNPQLARVLDYDDALRRWNEFGQSIKESRFSATSPTANQQRLPCLDLRTEKFAQILRQCTGVDKVVNREPHCREFADGDGRIRPDDGRENCGKTAPVRQLGVEERMLFVEFPPEAICNDFKAGCKLPRIEFYVGCTGHLAPALEPPLPIWIAHDFADHIVQEQRPNRFRERQKGFQVSVHRGPLVECLGCAEA